MVFRLLADLIVVAHFAFLAFVVAGGLLLLRWPRLAWVHLPAVVWGAWIEFSGWICPLTPLENDLRQRGGEAGYSGGFIAHYVMPILYPAGLTRDIQVALGAIVLVLNALVYAWLLASSRRRREVSAP